jgi:hypothetical protein
MAEQVKNLRSRAVAYGWRPMPMPGWRPARSDGGGRQERRDVGQGPRLAAADFATGNLYALYWLLARARPTPPEQADTFARFAIFVQGKAWIGRAASTSPRWRR